MSKINKNNQDRLISQYLITISIMLIQFPSLQTLKAGHMYVTSTMLNVILVSIKSIAPKYH